MMMGGWVPFRDYPSDVMWVPFRDYPSDVMEG